MQHTIHMPHIPASSSPASSIIAILVAIAGICIPFAGLGYIDPGQDELYQALCVRGYEDSPLAMLTFFIGNLWCRLFGDTLIALRCLMVICHLTSIGLGCAYFYHRTHRAVSCALLFMLLSAMSTFTAMFIFNWDTGAYPFIVLCFFATLYYMSAETPVAAVLMGASCALMVLSRIPTICILPLFPIVIIHKTRRSTHRDMLRAVTLRDILFCLCAFIVTAIAVIGLMCGLGAYIASWNPDNIITGHGSISDYFGRLIDLGIPNLLLWLVAGFLYLSASLIVRVRQTLSGIITAIFAIIAAVAIAALMVNRINAPTADFGLAQGTLAITLLYLPVRRRFIDPSTTCPAAELWLVAVFSLIAAVGSNGMAERPLALPFIPVACAYLYPYRNTAIKCFFVMLTLLALKTSTGIIYHNYHSHRHRTGISRLDHIRLSDEAARLWNPVTEAVKALRTEGRTVRFWGLYKYHFQYAFNSDCTLTHQLYHYDETDPQLLGKVVSELSEADAVIFRGDKRWGKPCPLTVNTLISLGYRPMVISDDYTVLVR